MYERSVSSDNIVNRLKYASMFVCNEQFDQAEAQLDAIEKLITIDMVQFSSDRLYDNYEPEVLTKTPCAPSEIFMSYLRKLLFPVEFMKDELHCLPSHLIFEMYRTITDEDRKARPSTTYKTAQPKITFWPDFWFETAKIDALPFLYFLQYLSTKNKKKKSKAICNFVSYIQSDYILSRQGHFDTTWNIMGYFHEQSKNLPVAWKCYWISILCLPRNNAAYWHLFRLLGQVVYGTTY
ncbi:hypothetical protein DPMN_156063 [Dreissena polymorpha]|uniref:Uncharacterized protein n=1 Tax=Dreissena polymorpha TaxID=45954 RepID=A0A9D4JBZ0_DREPO|nr:hypothetical protein DPMN_156063 [Dreissena polymorpha]